MPQKPPAHWQQNNACNSAWGPGSPGQDGQFQGQQGMNQPQSQQQQPPKPGPAGSIRLLKRNEDVNTLFPAQNATKKQTEFEELIANLKITKGNEPTSQSEEPLSPQSFAMKGTLALKEMLNIGSAPDSTSLSSSNTQQQNRRRATKKLAARMGDLVSPVSAAAVPPLQAHQPSSMGPSVASELARICVGLGMAPPDFTFIRSRQGLMVCQVKLSSGLLVHGPQSHSENEAKEKAALFALQRLNSVGSGFPMPPPLFSGVSQIRGPSMGPMPNIFGQSGGLLIPPQGYGPLHWGMPLPPHQGQPFYGGTFPGARPQAPSVPIGSHNQFVPLQVTKKRVSSGKKPQEFYNAAHTARNQAPSNKAQSDSQPSLSPAPSAPPAAPITPLKTAQDPPEMAGTSSTPQTPRQNPTPGHGHTPSSASKRKHRKLAVNFEVAKVQE
nr:5'-3' exoribonuclease 1-like [Oncorhynchus nerka]